MAPLSDFPSIATTSPSKLWAIELMNWRKHFSNALGSRDEKTLRKVSALGVRPGMSRNVLNQSALDFANNASESQPSTPTMTPHKAITKMFSSECARVRSMRGSGSSSKC